MWVVVITMGTSSGGQERSPCPRQPAVRCLWEGAVPGEGASVLFVPSAAECCEGPQEPLQSPHRRPPEMPHQP